MPKMQFLDANGNPLAAGKLYTYAAGTSTPKTTYSDSGGTSNANPVILDAGGFADVWLGTGAYKFVLKSSADVTQWTVDDIQSSAITTKGDLIVGDASGNETRLAVGADGEVLTADSTVTKGVKWAARPDLTVLNKSASYTALISDDFITCDATSAGFTITFPAAGSATNKVLICEKTDSSVNVVTLSGTGLTTNYLAKQGEALAYVSNGSNWILLWRTFYNDVVQSKTTTYTAKLGEVIACDATSGAFTVTFPTAATANTNRTITVKKTDSSFNAITLSGTGLTTNYLMTEGEVAQFISNGSSWIQVFRKTDTPWTTFTQTIKGISVDPTKGTGGSDTAKWRRVGDSIEVMWQFTQTAGGTAGTGNYYYPIPNGSSWTIDSNKMNTGALSSCVGNHELETSGGFHGPVMVYSTQSVGLKLYNDANSAVIHSSTFQPWNTTTLYIFMQYRVPITNFSA